MKWITLLFSLHIFVMSCISCTDDIMTIEAKQTVSLLSTDQDQQSNQVDWCSPFCICNCCAGVVLDIIQNIDVLPATSFNKMLCLYKQDFTAQFYYSIWQPPKI